MDTFGMRGGGYSYPFRCEIAPLDLDFSRHRPQWPDPFAVVALARAFSVLGFRVAEFVSFFVFVAEFIELDPILSSRGLTALFTEFYFFTGSDKHQKPP